MQTEARQNFTICLRERSRNASFRYNPKNKRKVGNRTVLTRKLKSEKTSVCRSEHAQLQIPQGTEAELKTGQPKNSNLQTESRQDFTTCLRERSRNASFQQFKKQKRKVGNRTVLTSKLKSEKTSVRRSEHAQLQIPQGTEAELKTGQPKNSNLQTESRQDFTTCLRERSRNASFQHNPKKTEKKVTAQF